MRRWVVVGIVAVMALVVTAVVSRDEGGGRSDAQLAVEALRRLPPDAAAVGLVTRRGLDDLLDRVPGSAIGLARLRQAWLGRLDSVVARLERLDGGPVAVAVTRDLDDLVVAWAAQDEVELEERLPELAVDGRVVVAATEPTAVRAALRERRGQAGAARRLLALPESAMVRAVSDVRRLRAAPGMRRLREIVPSTVARARDLTLTVTAGRDALTARAAVRFTPGTRLPLAPGRRPAAPAAFATPLTVALRDPAPALPAVLRALGATEGWQRANRILGSLRRDDLDEVIRDQLTGTTTVALHEPRRVAVQLRLRDAGGARDLLDDVARIPDLLLGRTGLDVDEDGGVYTLRLPDAPPLRIAAEGDRLGIVTAGDPRAVARRAPAARTTPGAGALAARFEAPDLRELVRRRLGLPRLALIALEALGDATVGATAGRERLDVTATLAISP